MAQETTVLSDVYFMYIYNKPFWVETPFGSLLEYDGGEVSKCKSYKNSFVFSKSVL